MAGVYTVIYSQAFADQQVITVNHNKNTDVQVGVIINGVALRSAIEKIVLDSEDPKNKLTIFLKESLTGVANIYSCDLVEANQISAQESAAISASNFSPNLLVLKQGDVVFGTEYNRAFDSGEWSTSSSFWEQRLKLRLTDMPAGEYFVGWKMMCRNSKSNINRWTESKIELDNNIILSQNIHTFLGYDTFSGNVIVDLDGDHEIDLDYRRDGTNSTAYAKDPEIFVWRVL
jgi:hypothetical protein